MAAPGGPNAPAAGRKSRDRTVAMRACPRISNDQRRALRVLAGGPHGCTEASMLAHGFKGRIARGPRRRPTRLPAPMVPGCLLARPSPRAPCTLSAGADRAVTYAAPPEIWVRDYLATVEPRMPSRRKPEAVALAGAFRTGKAGYHPSGFRGSAIPPRRGPASDQALLHGETPRAANGRSAPH